MIEHIPVLPLEVIKYLAPQKNENFIDATTGLGGHAKLILEKTGPEGKLLAIDQDKIALEKAQENLKDFNKGVTRVTYINKNFRELGLIIRQWPVETVNGVLMDLGVSTYQLTSPERGFSFNFDAVLDMRMAPESQRISAKEIVNKWRETDLKKILKNYGEEPFAGKISREILKQRQLKPIIMTNDLVEVIKRALPPAYRHSREKHFATSTFRALRMVVNNELEVLESGLKQAVQVLSFGGRLVVITFHSLEDRIVKNFLKENTSLNVITNKPIIALPDEINRNPKARSAKLRAAIKQLDN